MPSLAQSPTSPGHTNAFPRLTSSRFHNQRRIGILFVFMILTFSGSLIILRISSNQIQESDNDETSSVIRWTAKKFTNSRQWSESQRREREEKEAEEELVIYRESHRKLGRPRLALPHHDTFQDEYEQRRLQKELAHQEEELKQLREQVEQQLLSLELRPTKSPKLPESALSPEAKQIEAISDSARESIHAPRPFEVTLEDNGSTKYFTYLPYAGITDQFYGMLRGMEVAKALGRTLIIPPITGSIHDESKQNQPWSKFLDLKRFSKVTGVKVVEFHDLRDAELTEYNELQCGITCGVGSKDAIDFTAEGFLRQWRLNATLGSLPADESNLDGIISMLKSLQDDKYVCISNTYKILVKDKSEWERFGQHLHFSKELEGFVEKFLDKNAAHGRSKVDMAEIGNVARPDGHRFITIHARRGDFVKYCKNNFTSKKMIHCLSSTEQIADRVNRIQKRLNPNMNAETALPVFVATNERDPDESRQFEDLGWNYVNHEEMGTIETLGVFGPMMVDQVLLAHAEAFIGIQMSTFSHMGALRQRDWHGREIEYM
ncbi:GDP-fucose protein O-fucosyltransferase-domain-containing protein [Dissophora ornata]|nr:hypothetical protein BGZ58_005743 [Dissophora ornata]KAI8604320.1 GDP-fucose protein O-fucosyltransferase-domain-containing protein [Dissophora ornata]